MTTPPAYQRERRRLAEALKALRSGAGLSGARLAEVSGWGPTGQSKVSKIETRKQLPDEADLVAWVTATNAPPGALDDLIAMLRGARIEYASWKDAFREVGADQVQADIAEVEAQSTRIAEFQPAMISGFLQTAEYAREMLHRPCGPLSFGESEENVEQMIANRLQRQRALYDPAKQVQVVMLEGALRTRIVSAPTLAGQLDRLMAVTGLPSVELGVIPFTADLPVFPLPFRLYDDLVIVESIVGEQQLAEADNVTRYENYLKLLRDAAVTGEGARRLITAAAASLRGDERQ